LDNGPWGPVLPFDFSKSSQAINQDKFPFLTRAVLHPRLGVCSLFLFPLLKPLIPRAFWRPCGLQKTGCTGCRPQCPGLPADRNYLQAGTQRSRVFLFLPAAMLLHCTCPLISFSIWAVLPRPACKCSVYAQAPIEDKGRNLLSMSLPHNGPHSALSRMTNEYTRDSGLARGWLLSSRQGAVGHHSFARHDTGIAPEKAPYEFQSSDAFQGTL